MLKHEVQFVNNPHLKIHILFLERKLFESVYQVEDGGIRIKQETLKEYGKELEKGIRLLEKEIYTLAEEEFNINSPKQLGIILFEKLKQS